MTASNLLGNFYKKFSKNDRVLVVIKPDPDSIASAMGISFLLRRTTKLVDIAKVGVIKRLDNKAMIRVLKIKLKNYFKVNLEEYDKFVIVDGQPAHFGEEIKLPEFDVVIDHHPICEGTRRNNNFVDVRPKFGACSTIIEEYIRLKGWKPTKRLATALCYGIKSDTNNFERSGTHRDVTAFSNLFPRINHEALKMIERWEFTRLSIPYIKKSFRHLYLSRSTLFAYLGRVDDPDILVIMADFFTHTGGINLVVIAGLYDGKLSVVFRSDGIRRSASKLATHAFGKYGPAGGHKTAARAEIPLENLEEELPSTAEGAVVDFIISRIKMKRCKKD
jgi:nanoRNase/pAp phosphatase (c-di-AMP/oligoRNAs hydrolase)